MRKDNGRNEERDAKTIIYKIIIEGLIKKSYSL